MYSHQNTIQVISKNALSSRWYFGLITYWEIELCSCFVYRDQPRCSTVQTGRRPRGSFTDDVGTGQGLSSPLQVYCTFYETYRTTSFESCGKLTGNPRDLSLQLNSLMVSNFITNAGVQYRGRLKVSLKFFSLSHFLFSYKMAVEQTASTPYLAYLHAILSLRPLAQTLDLASE